MSRVAPEVTEWDLWWAFQVFGVILECHVPTNPTTEESKGIAFVRFADFAACEKALFLMEGQVIAGREISVRFAHDCVLPEHLKGTPWQGKKRLTGQVTDYKEAAEAYADMPEWVQQVRRQLSEEEQRHGDAGSRDHDRQQFREHASCAPCARSVGGEFQPGAFDEAVRVGDHVPVHLVEHAPFPRRAQLLGGNLRERVAALHAV